ncbi:hypothetical protein ACFE04_005321 [Oxalis oulophora]
MADDIPPDTHALMPAYMSYSGSAGGKRVHPFPFPDPSAPSYTLDEIEERTKELRAAVVASRYTRSPNASIVTGWTLLNGKIEIVLRISCMNNTCPYLTGYNPPVMAPSSAHKLLLILSND